MLHNIRELLGWKLHAFNASFNVSLKSGIDLFAASVVIVYG